MTRDREYRFVADLAGAQALQEGAVILRVRQYRWYAKISSVAPAVVRASSWSVDPPKDPPAGTIIEYRDTPADERVHRPRRRSRL